MELANTIKPFSNPENLKKCQYYFNRMKSTDRESVLKIPKEIRETIRENSPKRLLELADTNCFCADKIKTALDKKYGEGKYVLIAIGRSISSIAELIGKIGAETKIIPLSDLRHVDSVDKLISTKQKEIYRRYLESIGLSEDIIKNNPDKNYILMDYTHYGTTLRNAKDFLNEIFGNVPNLIEMPIETVLNSDYEQRGISTLFQLSRFKDYSLVGKLPVKEIENVYQQACEDTAKEYKGSFTKTIRKLFRLLTMDAYLKGNYDNTVPVKEINLIHERYYSLNAIRKKVRRANNTIKNVISD